MRSRLLALAALALLVVPSLGMAAAPPLAPAPPPGAPVPLPAPDAVAVMGHNDLLFQHDADGAVSVRGLIDDEPAQGTYVYTRVDLRNANRTAGGVLRLVNPVVGEAVSNTPMPIEEAGAYEHRWTRSAGGASASMVTVGVYYVARGEGMVRIPLVIFENVASLANAVDVVSAMATDDALDTVNNLLPFLLELAEPTTGTGFGTYPSGSATNTYADRLPLYAWLVRKFAAGREVWLGLYSEREGSYQGGSLVGQDARGTRTLDHGTALRVDAGGVVKLAGVWVRHDFEKQSTPYAQSARSLLTVGATTPAGRTPLAAMENTDARWDAEGQIVATPDRQADTLSIGTFVNGQYTPLVGARTDATMQPFTCPPTPPGQPAQYSDCLAYERITSLGAYVGGTYVPLAGFRFRGEQNAPVDWVLRYVNGGGPGSQNMGNFDLDVGTFHGGEFLPLAGARYRTQFAEARFPFQAMVTVGVHGPAGYQPVLGLTYDGALPIIAWANAYVAGDSAKRGDWMATAGTFAGERYVPVVGVRYQNRVPSATYQDQQRFTMGAFVGTYHAFVPLVVVDYEGDQPVHAWAAAFALGGAFGAKVGEWNVAAGSAPLGLEVPVLGVRYRQEYGSGAPFQGFVTVGVFAARQFVPLVGVGYSGQDTLGGSTNAPTSVADDDPWSLTAGVFVMGAYTPLVGVATDPKAVGVTLLPSYI